MVTVNLIPAGRYDAKRRRARTRVWVGICAVYGGLLLIGYGACYGFWGSGDRGLDEDLEKTTQRIETHRQQVVTLDRAIARANRILRANQAIGAQPDWSVLLALLAETLGDELVLSRFRLEPRDEPDPQSAGAGRPDVTRSPLSVPLKRPRARAAPKPVDPLGAGQTEFVVRISGYGRSQAAVSQFVLRLEGIELFRKVRLVKANREPFLAAEAVAFLVECSLGPRSEESS